MSKLYVNSDFWVNLTWDDATVAGKIRYQVPGSSLIQEKTGVAVDESKGEYKCKFPRTENLVPGPWKVWLRVTFADGDISTGEPVEFQAYEEGK